MLLNLLTASLLSLVQANGAPQQHHHDGGDDEWEGGIEVNVRLIPDSGVWPFQFGPAGTFARQAFQINTYSTLVLFPFDCYCGGDSFIVYDNGQELVQVNGDCLVAESTCENYTNNPYECLHNWQEAWCGSSDGFIPIYPGRHNFTILTTASPYGGGIGFLQLNWGCYFEGHSSDNNEGTFPCCYQFLEVKDGAEEKNASDDEEKIYITDAWDYCNYEIVHYKGCPNH